MLKANFTVRAFEEGGNFSIDRFSLPYSPYNSYVGIKVPEGNNRWTRTLSSDSNHIIRIVTRPVQPLGKDIGFLPGTLAEKMEPWIAPIRDNVAFLVNNKRPQKSSRKMEGGKRYDDGTYLSLMQERGLIEIEAITFIRGRSIPNSFIIIDEAQNLTKVEILTLLTRVGYNTKIVLTGDESQSDRKAPPYL
jgi:predicted ribonuclease YlaK